jgi:YD repeat-containing protein
VLLITIYLILKLNNGYVLYFLKWGETEASLASLEYRIDQEQEGFMFKLSSKTGIRKTKIQSANVVVSFLLLISLLLSGCGPAVNNGSSTRINDSPNDLDSVDTDSTSSNSNLSDDSSQSDESGTSGRYTPPEYVRPVPVKGSHIGTDTQSNLASLIDQTISQKPMTFIENEGQFADGARFQIPGKQGTMFFAENAIWLSLIETPTVEEISTKYEESTSNVANLKGSSPTITATPAPYWDSEEPVTRVNVRLTFEGSDSDPTMEGFDPLESNVSYFIGNDPQNWHADVPVWGGVRYKEIYPGYDLEITSQDGVWTWNLVQNQNAVDLSKMNFSTSKIDDLTSQNDTGNLRLRIEGTQNLAIDGNVIRITTELGEVDLPLPTLKQTSLTKNNSQQIRQLFQANAYLDEDVVVLPISLPTSREKYSPTETPESTETPMSMNKNHAKLLNGDIDPRIRFTPALASSLSSGVTLNNLFFSTFIGNGDGNDLFVDSDGNVYIVGTTSSTSFPTTTGSFQTSLAGGSDAFVTKLNSDGKGVSYSTYIGGSASTDEGNGIAVDSNGAAYIVGRTLSSNYPTTSGAFDQVNSGSEAFITKLSADGTALVYSTFLGVGNTQGFHIALNDAGNAYIVGQTQDSSFPTTSGAYDQTINWNNYGAIYDGFVTELNTSGTALVFSTFLGGGDVDCEVGGVLGECDIALGPDDTVYVAGTTYSSDFPTTTGAYDRYYNGNVDIFALKLSASGSSLLYSTYLGGYSADDCNGKCSLAVDPNGNAYITGSTESYNFPVTTGAWDTSSNGGDDVFLSKLSSDGSSLVYSTFLGTSGTDEARGISVSENGEAVIIGRTTSSGFPITTDALQDTYGGGSSDAFFARFSADGNALAHSSYLGGAGDELGTAIVAKGNRNIFVIGQSSSTNFPITAGAYRTTGNIFVSKIAAANDNAPVYIPSTYNSSGLDNISTLCCTYEDIGNPINTFTGGEYYQVKDLNIPTSVGQLAFERTYSSLTTDLYTTDMGYGWTNSFDTRLIFPSDPLGEEGYILFKQHSANLYRFSINTDGSYSPDAGVLGSLELVNGNYVLTLPDQTLYEFNPDGLLQTISDPEGHSWVYTYDLNDRLEQVDADDGDRYLTLDYDNQGRIVSVADHTDRSVSFEYDVAGDLVGATDVMSGEWQYEYDSYHHLTEVIDPLNHTVERNEYDSQGRVINQWDGLDNLVAGITYNINGTRTIENALENVQTHSYDSRNTLTENTDATNETTSKEYNQNFRPSKITDALDHETNITWSADGANLTGILDAAGNETSILYDSLNNPIQVVDPLENLTTYEYDGKLLTKTADALSGETEYTYTSEGYLETVTDPLGNITSYTYDDYGQRLTMTDALDNTWQYVYDDLGRQISTTDPLGRVTRNTYDDAGHVTETIRNYDANRDPNEDNQYNISTTYTYDAGGNQTTVTDTYGNTTTYTYDDAGRLVQTTDPDNNTIINTYDDAGQLITVTDALNHETHYSYDDAGRQIAITDALNHTTHTTYNPDGTIATTTDALENETQYSYDDMKRVVAVTDAYDHTTYTSYDENGNVATTTDALGNVTHYEYDALGRQIEKIDPLDGVTQSFYDAGGNLLQTIDPNGNATTYAYDENNHLVSVTDELGDETKYEYDDAGRRTAVVDAVDNRTEFTFDNLDRTVSVSDPLNHTSITEYDALGHVLFSTDANGNTISYEYDNLYRQVSQTDAEDGETIFAYDAAGNRTSVTDPNGKITTTTYDDVNRPVEVTDALDQTSTTEYDAAGHVISTTDANAKSTTYEYDDLGRQISITDPNEEVTYTSYDAAGQITEKTDAMGVMNHYVYDDLGRLVGVVENYKENVTPDNETNVTTTYTYDANGNRLSITDGNSNTTTFSYDELNRLTEETDPLDHSWQYTYDELGHRTGMTDANNGTTSYNYDDSGNLIEIDYPGTYADVSYTYDAAGRRTGMTNALGTTSWEYDDANRTTSVTDPFSATVSYAYDANGNRTELTYPDNKTVSYAYDDINRLTGTTDWSNQTTQYAYDPVGRLLSILRPNGVNSAYTYNDVGQLTQLQYVWNTDILADYQYSYDSNGNRTSVSEAVLLPKLDTIFSDSFESGDLTAWSSVETDNGNLAISSTFPIEGSYSIQATADGQIELYVQDDLPRHDTYYDARFYFDPNSIAASSGDSIVIFQGQNEEDVLFQVKLRKTADGYEIATKCFDGLQQGIESSWNPLTDELHAIELEWQASSGLGAEDGYTSIWVDDVVVAEVTDIDNDTARIENVELGILTPSSSNFSGAVLFDLFTSKRTGHIGIEPSVIPPAYGRIFMNSFESGDLSAWSDSETDSGNLSVSSASPIEGSYSLHATADSEDEMYVQDDLPGNESSYHARFYFDPNSISASPGDSLVIFQGKNANGDAVFQVLIKKISIGYEIKTTSTDDLQQPIESSWSPLTDDLHAIELAWQASSGQGSDDGYSSLLIDNLEVAGTTEVDNDTVQIDSVETGILSPSSDDFSGAIIFDDFSSNRFLHIGLNPNIRLPGSSFSDDFESGDLSAWSSAVTDSGNLSVSTNGYIEGTYSLEAITNGQNQMYVQYDPQQTGSLYDARFYFNPNSITAPIGDSIAIFQGQDSNGLSFQVKVRTEANGYEIGIVGFNDNRQAVTSSWVPFANIMHAVELEWEASSATGANDGSVLLWLDGAKVAEITNVDNDSVEIESTRLGIISPSSEDFLGTVYFDDFGSNFLGRIGLDPNVPLPTIFLNSFDWDGLSAWTSAQTDGGNLAVSSVSPMQGSHSLRATFDGQDELYVQDENPSNENVYHARFYFNPNLAAIPEDDYFTIFKGTGSAGTAFSIVLGKVEGDYRVKAVLVHDDNSSSETNWIPLEYGPNHIEIEWWQAWNSSTPDGRLKLWVNDTEQGFTGDVDNDTKSIESVQMGILSPSSTNITGTIIFDDFLAVRLGDFYIGTDPNVTLPDYDQIFSDDYESGNFAAWSSAETDDGNLSVSSASPIEGDYTLQAELDGLNEMYVQDDHPLDEPGYSARFYFDPNSVGIPAEESIEIFKGMGLGGAVFSIRLTELGGDYLIKAVLWDDNDDTIESDWTPVENGPNCIEVNWWRAWGPSTPDGRLKLRVNDEIREFPGDVGNYSRTVNSIQMGLLSPTSASVSGTILFDDFTSVRGGDAYIGFDQNVTLPDYDEFFLDGFESGDLSAWSLAETDSGSLSVTTSAALAGTYGMQGEVDEQTEMYVEDDSPTAETVYHARFYFDPNSVEIPEDDHVDILRGDGIGGEAFTVRLGWVDDEYAIQMVLVDDDSYTTESDWVPVADAPICIEIGWNRAWGEESQDGWIDLWIDDSLEASLEDADNDTKSIGFVQMGVLSPSSDDISGTVYFDDFVSNSTGYIGGNENMQLMRSIPQRLEASPVPPLSAAPRMTATPQGGAQTATPRPSATPTRPPTATATITPIRATRTNTPTPMPSTTALAVTPPVVNRPPQQAPEVTMNTLSLNAVTQSQIGNWSIDYTYDALNRLTGADASNGDYFHYTYDAVGNRLEVETNEDEISYTYDDANRLVEVDSVAYTWDNNGNLLGDGVNTYTYDGANRLISVNGQTTYAYDGLGNRLQQTTDNITTSYTLDLNAPYTQVLSDGANTYLYGLERINQQNGTDTEYFLGDALGSVRQLTNATGDVTLTRAYDTYGNPILSVGDAQSDYGYTGEFTDASGLVYLRARYYEPRTR